MNNDWLAKLNSNGCRLTAARKAVVQVLSTSDRVLTPTDLYFKAHQSYPSIGLVTVYRTLEKLEELGLIQRVYFEDGGFGYFASSGSHKHLLVCQDCHRVEFFSGDDLGNLMQEVGDRSGYEVRDHWLQFSGLCAKCR